MSYNNSIICAHFHTIIQTVEGVFSSGSNIHGNLGLGKTYVFKNVDILTKLNFFDSYKIISVTCGCDYTIIQTNNGVFVFGNNLYNQLGFEHNITIMTPTKLKFFDSYEIISITCGASHTIIQTTEGLFGFGYNNSGQLGLGHTNDIQTPTKLDFFNLYNIFSVACGKYHTIVHTDGGLFGFGNNLFNELCLGNAEDINIPTKLIFFDSFNIISINCGGDHTIIYTDDGLFGFGNNLYGQLGLGHNDSVDIPTKILFFQRVEDMEDNYNIISISCGNHTIIQTTGGIFGFGSNNHGQLGLNHYNDVNAPTKLKFFNSYNVISITCGIYLTIIHTDNGLFGFGRNDYGQLGLGHTHEVKVPTKLGLNHNIIAQNYKHKIKSTMSLSV